MNRFKTIGEEYAEAWRQLEPDAPTQQVVLKKWPRRQFHEVATPSERIMLDFTQLLARLRAIQAAAMLFKSHKPKGIEAPRYQYRTPHDS